MKVQSKFIFMNYNMFIMSVVPFCVCVCVCVMQMFIKIEIQKNRMNFEIENQK